jgi:hypothetical protein
MVVEYTIKYVAIYLANNFGRNRKMRHYFDNQLITDSKAYWANHFASILECIHYHKQLQFSPSSLPAYPTWSLSDLRGNMPENFFLVLNGYVRNWGFQYFIAQYLNQKCGSIIVEKLMERLQEYYPREFPDDLNRVWFFVSGSDSAMSNYLQENYDGIYPEVINGVEADIDKLKRNSDLCMVISTLSENKRLGVFGEVEGNNGYKLETRGFWSDKPLHCVFGVGVISGESKSHFIEAYNGYDAPKVNVFFESSHHVVSDFLVGVSCVENLLRTGPRTNPLINSKDDELDFFVSHLRNNWNVPILDIISFLHKFIDFRDYVGKNINILPYVPSIQAG